MAPYSMDLRTRVLADRDAGLTTQAVAAKYRVSVAWVNRITQRRREKGETTPRKQTRWRTPILAGHAETLQALVAERPDRTLVEIRAALATPASVTTVWRALNRLGLSVKKNGPRR